MRLVEMGEMMAGGNIEQCSLDFWCQVSPVSLSTSDRHLRPPRKIANTNQQATKLGLPPTKQPRPPVRYSTRVLCQMPLLVLVLVPVRQGGTGDGRSRKCHDILRSSSLFLRPVYRVKEWQRPWQVVLVSSVADPFLRCRQLQQEKKAVS